jgi:hypothetical protein
MDSRMVAIGRSMKGSEKFSGNLQASQERIVPALRRVYRF